jgi:hypothetical protein
MNFRKFLEHNPLKIYGSFTSNPEGPGNTVGKHNDGNSGYFASTAWTGSESNTDKPFVLPGVDLVKMPDIDSIKLGDVNYLKDDSPIEIVKGDEPRPGYPPKNPIEIILKSGRRIFMTFDEFKRAGGKEKIKKNNKLTWTLMPKGKFYQVQSIT